MDLRIVNTCNNDCLYCLEQSYRSRKKFIEKKEILKNIKTENIDKIITFYGGNPLLHPNLLEIIETCKNYGFYSIGILSNTKGLNNNLLKNLIKKGLNNFGFYFNSFDEKKHKLIVNGGICLDELIGNLSLLNFYKINKKAIIHINKQNISTIYKDIIILNKKYGINQFEFINYFPFDRPYKKYREFLSYSYIENKKYINYLLGVIKKLNLEVSFLKFSKKFFGIYNEFYNYEKGVKNQIGKEDIERLKGKNPFCLKEKRCKNCFIEDFCKILNK